ncbi:hypothetical protein ABZ490_44585 [Streptomyces sp. NPDC005811]|uniref:hypothetical protein n=1 Tax=Streptomyces sp. NPDC005811 TaxID=3154565 RepID=UPI0033EACC50
MPSRPIPAAPPGRTPARVLGAMLSLIVLTVAVAGLPMLLAQVTPLVWAAAHDDLVHLLDRQDTGAAFLLLLVAVGWIGWAQFGFCAACELIAQLRGRTWRAPRGMGASQRAAAVLIGSILVLLPTGSALAFDAHAAAPTRAAAAADQAAQTQAAAIGQASPASVPATADAARTYTVRERRPAESLWAIAEAELGDGARWREIAALNEGRTMADGLVFSASSFLQPGWQLRMPATAPTAEGLRTQLDDEPEAAPEAGGRIVTVRPGDYLSKIAKKELGDGDKWPTLFTASAGRPQPNGLPEITDPDVIYAGQQVTVPESRSAPSSTHPNNAGSRDTTPAPDQAPGTGESPGDGTAGAPAPHSPATATPGDSGTEQPQATPDATPRSPTSSATAPASGGPSHPAAASSPAATAAETPSPAPSAGPLTLHTVLGAGALLAAAVTGALSLRRALQRRRRKPGEKIAIAAHPSPAEAQLAAAAEPEGAARLDVALRTLAHQAAQHDQAALPPPLRAARIGARTVDVLPEELAQEPLAPFNSGQDGWWTLPADAELLNEDDARAVPAPYPGLVTIGSTPAGDLLLLNLAQLPALLLDGNPLHITEVCTSLALELGMSPWAGDVEVVTVGFGEDLPQLLPTARISHLRHAAHALRDLGEHLLEAHQIPESRHQPYLLLCASALDADTAWQFADLIDKADTVPVTLIAPANTTAAHFPEAEILNASLSEPQALAHTGTHITVQRLEHTAYQQITTALKVSGQPAHPAEEPWQNIPDEPDHMQQPEQTTATEPSAPAAAAPDVSPTDPPDAATVPIAPTNAAARTVAPTAPTDAGGGVFPALLAATTGPSAIRPLPLTLTTVQVRDRQHPASAPDTAPSAERADTASVPATAHHAGQEPDAHQADDPIAPEIRVLGPVEVTGVDHTGHGPKMAQLAALLYFRPGRTADTLCLDMDPLSPWAPSTLNARLQGLRRCLGSDLAGHPYVPRRTSGEDPYRLSADVRCDWTRFLQLAEPALPQGPAGLADLEEALALVRGRPFGTRPLPWAQPLQQEMTTRIIDVAHTVAAHRTPAGPHHDLHAARRAVACGLDADDSAEVLYRDWLRIEHTAGNRHGLHTAITRIQHINQMLDCSLEPETEHLINHLLNTPAPPPHTRQTRRTPRP